MTNDASPSWNGFSFQAKITLYQVLCKIKELNYEEDDIHNFSFIIEGEEDYDFLKNGETIELGQVKAKLSKKYLSDYYEAIVKLHNRKSFKDNQNVKLTFHTAIEIIDWDIFEENFASKIPTISSNDDQKTKENKEEKIYLLNQVRSALGDIQLVQYPNTNSDNTPTSYCSLDNINSLLFDEIKEYFLNTNQQSKSGDSSIHKYLIEILNYLNEHINQRHKERSTEKCINFSKISSILDTDLLKNDNEYNYGKILDRFVNDAFPDYCNYHCPHTENCNRNNCYLSSVFNIISNETLNNSYNILRRSLPHKYINDLNEQNYLFDAPSIRFYYSLFAPQKLQEDDLPFILKGNSFRHETREGSVFFPTGISKVPIDERESHKREYIENFKRNLDEEHIPIEDIYEVNGYITGNIDADNILEKLRAHDEEFEPQTEKDMPSRRNQINISLISRNNLNFKEEI